MSSIGIDRSGNGNNWTSNNLTQYDVMVDSPTNNFVTFNPLVHGGADLLSEGNLKSVGTSSGKSYRPSTVGVDSGKFYFEGVITIGAAGAIGVCIEGGSTDNSMGKDDFSWAYHTGGTIRHNDVNSSYGASYTTGDIIGAAVDIDNGTIVFFKNGSSQGSYSIVGFSPDTYFLGAGDSTTGSGTGWVLNFGADSSFAGAKTPQGNSDSNGIGDFFYPVPSGFLSLCTKNLASVDVIPSEHFNPVIYSGTGADNRVLSGVGFTPDLGIFKRRNGTGPSQFFDTLRGNSLQLRSDTTSAESTQANKQKTFTSDGYTLGTDAQINGSGGTYVAWNWKAGGSASSNSNGTITSSVSANAAAGFSIVSYTGTGVNATVGHGLSVAPEMIIVKNRDVTDVWLVYHDGLASDPQTDYIILNRTDAKADLSTAWNDTAPTSTVFSIGSLADVSRNNSNLIAYCFHSVEGYSKVGSYVGNGNADGPFVHCGFRPAYVLFKRTDTTGDWVIIDSTRSEVNVAQDVLFTQVAVAEEDNALYKIDYLSNGFKIRNTISYMNASGGTYIFLAFAESPFKHSNAR